MKKLCRDPMFDVQVIGESAAGTKERGLDPISVICAIMYRLL